MTDHNTHTSSSASSADPALALGLDVSRALASFSPTEAALTAIRDEAREILAYVAQAGIEDDEVYTAVREKRLALRSMRTTIEGARKSMKAGALEYGRAVDAEAKRLTAITEPEEDALRAAEQEYAARAAAAKAEIEARAQAKLDARIADMHAAGSSLPASALQAMSDEEYEAALGEARSALAARLETERAAAEEAERARREEEERRAEAARAEAARLEAERLEREAAAAEERRKAAEERAALERELAAQRAEQQRIEAEREAERAAMRQREYEERERFARMERDLEVERAKVEAARLEALRVVEEAHAREAEEKARLARVEEAKERARAERARVAQEAAERAERAKRHASEVPLVRAFIEAVGALDIPDVWCADEIGALRGEMLVGLAAIVDDIDEDVPMAEGGAA